MREGEAGVHGVAVEFEAVGEAVQVGQVSGSGGGDPGGELGVVAFGWGEEFGETADQAGEFVSSGHVAVSSCGSWVSLSRSRSGRVSRRRARRRGVMTGRSPSARSWVM